MNSTRRDTIKSLIASAAAISFASVSFASSYDNQIEDWADLTAKILAYNQFTEQIFDDGDGKKYHSSYPVQFVLVPCKNRMVAKQLIEFPAKSRRVYVDDNSPLSFQQRFELVENLKRFLINEAHENLAKTDIVDFNEWKNIRSDIVEMYSLKEKGIA